MKKFLTLILLGFFVFQVSATPKLEVKQDVVKTEMVKQFTDVVIDFDAVIFSGYSFKENQFLNFKNSNPNTFAIMPSVCWSSNLSFSYNSIYKERLNQNYTLDKKLLLQKLGITLNLSC